MDELRGCLREEDEAEEAAAAARSAAEAARAEAAAEAAEAGLGADGDDDLSPGEAGGGTEVGLAAAAVVAAAAAGSGSTGVLPPPTPSSAVRPPPIKSVVFSQWTGMLDIVEAALRREPRLSSFCRLDGAMSSDERQKALRRFRDERGVRVMLLSLRAGGVGLNLTSARRVFLLDPWFNPAVEEQAMDRVHRLGQTHPVIVTRFIMRGTVEERMLSLQETKRQQCQAVLGGADDGDLDEAARGAGGGAGGGGGARRAARDKARQLRLKDLAHYLDVEEQEGGGRE
jgi:hypothetical protein